MEREKTATVVPVIALLLFLFFFYVVRYLGGPEGVLFGGGENPWAPTWVRMMRMIPLALVMGIGFAVDAVSFEEGQPVLRWPVSSIIVVYSWTTTAALISADLFSDQTLVAVACMILLGLGLALVRLDASWPMTLTALVGCCAALAIINTGLTYTTSLVSRTALYLCASILFVELVLLLRLAFRIKERRSGARE